LTFSNNEVEVELETNETNETRKKKNKNGNEKQANVNNQMTNQPCTRHTAATLLVFNEKHSENRFAELTKCNKTYNSRANHKQSTTTRNTYMSVVGNNKAPAPKKSEISGKTNQHGVFHY
jgi:hypothetical protein